MESDLQRILDSIGSSPPPSAVRAVWPEVQRALTGLPAVHVAVAATFTIDPLLPYLGWALARAGLGLQWTPVPFNQIYPQLLSPSSELAIGGADVAILLPRIEELLSEAWSQLPENPQRAREIANLELDSLTSGVRAFLEGYTGLLLVGNFIKPSVLPLGLLDQSSLSGGTAFTEWLNQEWRTRLSSFSLVRLLDVADVVADVGHQNALDLTRWYLGRIPFRESVLKSLASLITRYIRAWRSAPKKVIVLDCDGTLWGGVAGEDGPSGVIVGTDAPGNAFVAFQKYLLGLRRRGILIALCSKNTEDDVWGVFTQNQSMVLRKEDVSAWRINWDRKSDNLRAIARDLNVGLDSLVMVDDSPLECAEVVANCSEVAVVVLSDDPAEFIELVEGSAFFDRLTMTSEDLERHKMYAAEGQRHALRTATTSLDEYLQTLNLTVEIFIPKSSDLPRVAQLVERTNQFNLTTRRRTEGELRALGSDPAICIYCVRVRDRFGDYGITGTAIVTVSGDSACIDTFLLSCRVLARGVEKALLHRIAADVRMRGARQLRARYIPTKKNMPAFAFLDECGFGAKDSDGWQTMDLIHLPIFNPPHIRVEESVLLNPKHELAGRNEDAR